MAPPTETEILTNYLVQPAPLTALTTLSQFQALFPRAQRTSPLVRSLFRDLQAQRGATVDAVCASIATEAGRGTAMRREVLRARRDALRPEPDAELDMERALFGHVLVMVDGGDGGAKGHSLLSVLPELEGAVSTLEAEIGMLADEEETLRDQVGQTLGGLSDLRYGKLANGDLRAQVARGLDSLSEACRDKA